MISGLCSRWWSSTNNGRTAAVGKTAARQPQRPPDLHRIRSPTLHRAHTSWLTAATNATQKTIMLSRKPTNGSELPALKQELNTAHKRVRARVEHALAHM